MVYSGAWGKQIHEKNQKSKISWHCPFNILSLTWSWVCCVWRLWGKPSWARCARRSDSRRRRPSDTQNPGELHTLLSHSGSSKSFFLFIWYFLVHTFSPSHSYNTFIRCHSPRFLSISSSLVSDKWINPPWGAEPRIELGPALQQVDALTIWATQHPSPWQKLIILFLTKMPCFY